MISFNGMTCNGKDSRFSWARLFMHWWRLYAVFVVCVFPLCMLCVGPSHSHPCARQTLEDCTSPQGSVRNSSCRDSWYSEKEELFPLRAGHRREDSLDSLNSLGSRTYSTSSDATLKGSSEGKTLQSILCVLTWLWGSQRWVVVWKVKFGLSFCLKKKKTILKQSKWNKLWSAT